MRPSQLFAALILSLAAIGASATAQVAADFIPRSSEIYLEVSSAADLQQAFAADGPFREFFALPGLARDIPYPLFRGLLDLVAEHSSAEIAISVETGFLAQIEIRAAARSQSGARTIRTAIAENPLFKDLDLLPGNSPDSFEIAGLGEVAIRQGFLIISKTAKDIDELCALKPEDSMSQHGGLRQLRERSPNAQLRGFFSRALIVSDLKILGMKPDNFFGSLLLDGLRQDLAQAEEVFFQAELLPEFKLQLRGLGRKHPRHWTNPESDATTLPALDHEIGRLSLNHDLDEFWRNREKIVSVEALPGLAEFTQNFDTLLSGISTTEVIASLSPGLEIVVLEKDRSTASGQPFLPGFVLALNLKTERDEEFKDRLRVAFQTTIGAINLSAGAEHRRPYLQYSRQISGVEILAARFVGAMPFDEEQVSDNFQPALAIAGNRLFLCSDLEAATAAVAAELESATNPQPMRHQIELQGPGVERMLVFNRKLIEDQRLLKEGDTLEEASEFSAALEALAGSVKRMSFSRRLWSKGALWDFSILRQEKQ